MSVAPQISDNERQARLRLEQSPFHLLIKSATSSIDESSEDSAYQDNEDDAVTET